MIFNKRNLIIVVLVSIIIASLSLCCIEDSNDQDEKPGILVDPIPAGYEYIATLPNSNFNEFSEHIIQSKEEAYRDKDGLDVSIIEIELESDQSALEFISNYKGQYNEMPDGSRFTEIYFNDHNAVRIKKYVINDGTQVPRYRIIWNSSNIVYIVKSNSNLEESSLIMAKAIDV
ncbi:MAG: hypothetical protein C00003105_00768 [ANME-2 cluster archaeon HR1]|nr:MAG: hypothetical protein C00003105_00768 [ANME-2 cluster archaeon HR1]